MITDKYRNVIIGYNFKRNFGDDLMLLSNLKVCQRLNKHPCDIVSWLPGLWAKHEEQINFHGNRVNKISITKFRLLLQLLVTRQLIIFGGGNLFDNPRNKYIFLVMIFVWNTFTLNTVYSQVPRGRTGWLG